MTDQLGIAEDGMTDFMTVCRRPGQDLITDHPFTPSRWSTEPLGNLCAHVSEGGWTCGFSQAEHADQGES
jgi:hypothetical protein